MDLAYAVVHDDPPEVFAAEDVDILQWVIALEVVARTPASSLDPVVVERLREALLEERWAEGVVLWMETTGTVIDVYPDGLRVWTSSEIQPDIADVRLQFRPLFAD